VEKGDEEVEGSFLVLSFSIILKATWKRNDEAALTVVNGLKALLKAFLGTFLGVLPTALFHTVRTIKPQDFNFCIVLISPTSLFCTVQLKFRVLRNSCNVVFLIKNA